MTESRSGAIQNSDREPTFDLVEQPAHPCPPLGRVDQIAGTLTPEQHVWPVEPRLRRCVVAVVDTQETVADFQHAALVPDHLSSRLTPLFHAHKLAAAVLLKQFPEMFVFLSVIRQPYHLAPPSPRDPLWPRAGGGGVAHQRQSPNRGPGCDNAVRSDESAGPPRAGLRRVFHPHGRALPRPRQADI